MKVPSSRLSQRGEKEYKHNEDEALVNIKNMKFWGKNVLVIIYFSKHYVDYEVWMLGQINIKRDRSHLNF